MKIYSDPSDWKDLQNKVCMLLCQSGFNAETEKNVTTPRGDVELDVYAVDPNSIDKISYVVECKNWANSVNQSVILSFTTVMNETGCNIGYIVSKKGFQSGAIKYVSFTNIKLFTFEELQEHYYIVWMLKYFSPKVKNIIERLINYTEPFNSKRDKTLNDASDECKQAFIVLQKKYKKLAFLLLMATSDKDNTDHKSLERVFEECENLGLNLRDIPLYDILPLMKTFIDSITEKFDALFKQDIFEYSLYEQGSRDLIQPMKMGK